jgi:hypothetical protein
VGSGALVGAGAAVGAAAGALVGAGADVGWAHAANKTANAIGELTFFKIFVFTLTSIEIFLNLFGFLLKNYIS